MIIRLATAKDIPALVQLINSAYRGEESKKGWTTEADMVSGDLRTDAENIRELMNTPSAGFLKYSEHSRGIRGCVFFQQREPGKLYFGMLSVSPEVQAKGIGKRLMAALEDEARRQLCSLIYMRVISIRTELISWYERLGYKKTGETQEFPVGPFGTARIPLEFIVMEKTV